MPKETYSMNMRCNNCGYRWVEDFPKGTSVPIAPFYLCPYCGCKRGEPNGKWEPEEAQRLKEELRLK